MDDKYYNELVSLRMARAEELLADAKSMFQNGSYKSANNRAYYAMEKAINALLIHKHVEAKTHSGAMKMFNVKYVRAGNGYFMEEDYRIVAKAEQIRNVSDYDDFYIASRDETQTQIENAEYLVHKVKEYFSMT